MTFESKRNDAQLEVQFNSGDKVKFFDLETLHHEKHVEKARSTSDAIWAFYYKNYWKRDFSYITKGLSVDKKTGEGPELMLLGPVSYNHSIKKFVMTKPELVIGTDRLELYEHFARRREVLTAYNRNFLKLAVGITMAHFVIV